jgi:hypothetical protein
MSVNHGVKFGHFVLMLDAATGGSELANIFSTVPREMLKCFAAARLLMPSAHTSQKFISSLTA